MFKLFIFVVILGVIHGKKCGHPAIPSNVSRASSLIDFLTGKNGRIVGGVEATPHSWPWQVALLRGVGDPTVFCGGSIITEDYIMTAAHCCDGSSENTFVRVGAHDLRDEELYANTINVEKIIEHDQYDYFKFNNDFCLLKLKEKLTFSETVSPICLADAADGAVGSKCYITGWGNDVQGISSNKPGPVRVGDFSGRALHSRLRQVDVTVIEDDVCHKIYFGSSRPIAITDEMICARALGKDSCQGDSGGPLVCQSAPGEPFKLVGVISFGYGCADPKFPGVYARISTALDWIARTLLETR